MANLELEKRVAALEAKVAQLVGEKPEPLAASHAWFNKVFGIFAEDPEFDSAVRAGQEWRKTDGTIQ